MNGQQIFEQQLAVMQALKDGKQVQFRDKGAKILWQAYAGVKHDHKYLNFRDYEFRIKPVAKEIFVNEYSDGSYHYAYPTHEKAMDGAGHAVLRKAVKYREVIDDA